MIKFGMMIGDRYEILEKIGTGGMSDVYKAKCHKLNRFVAIKVLKQEFSENTNFVSKFRVEAQAAAGLMHANIVNVYDVGEENNIYYIVMELVEGITLKKYIEKKARLSVKEAVSIAIQVCLGIETAHNNHIIHRDIKPQNIIISKEGRVKVTDFGIAKAATSNTITSNVMGSVHYTSPEQARGGYSDAKSDIYSLGITLFEMLTGRVPFNGETTVAIAIKHIQDDMPSPRDYVAEIPVSVEQIVFKCTQKSPDRRYQTMNELIEDLKKSLISPDEDFVKIVDIDKNGQTKMMTDSDMKKIKVHADNKENRNDSMRLRTNHSLPKNPEQIRRNTEPIRKQSYEKEQEAEEFDPKMETITTILMVVAAVIIGCVVLYVVGNVMGIFPLKGKEQTQVSGNKAKEENVQIDKENDVKVVSIPDVVGKAKAEATKTLEDEGLTVIIETSESSKVSKDSVISQTPDGGTTVYRDSTVTLLVSKGSKVEEVVVPTLLGKTQEEARLALETVGLVLGKVDETYVDVTINNEYSVGSVYYQSYTAGGSVNSGTKVDIKVSLGLESITYSYNLYVESPNDMDYQGGDATVMLLGSDGSILWKSSSPTVFPVSTSVAGISNISDGKIVVSYTVTVVSQITDEFGDSTTHSVQEARSKEEIVVFVKEN